MSFRPFRLLALLMTLVVAASACNAVDLSADIELVDVQTGYFDNGVKDGKNHMLPYLAFKIRNVSDSHVSSVFMTVSFWVDDPQGHATAVAAAQQQGVDPPTEMTQQGVFLESQFRGVTSDGIAPGEETDQLVARPDVGYTLEGPRADFFVHRDFMDVTAKVFARHGGRIVQVGQFVLDRRIISSTSPDGL